MADDNGGSREETVDPSDHHIEVHLFCKQCLQEVPRSMSPEEYAQVEIGWTPWGMQVWCLRHNCNVLHVNYEGHEHPSVSTAKEVAGLEKPSGKELQ